MVAAALLVATPQCASIYQIPASVIFVNVPLDKANHMAKLRVTVREDSTTMCIVKVGFIRDH